MKKVDLNADLGESFGQYRIGSDETIIPYITSANIACGFHAGDPSVMRKTSLLCLQQGVSIGAHPGYPDLQGFGRRNMNMDSQEIYDMVLYQVGALIGIASAEGGTVSHVKPHGALYNLASKNSKVAEAIATALYKLDPELVLFGLAGSELIRAGRSIGLRSAEEVFADRTYQSDGRLTPRELPNSMVEDEKTASDRVIKMVTDGEILTEQGTIYKVTADTVCLHGDGPKAAIFAKELRTNLEMAGIEVVSCSQ